MKMYIMKMMMTVSIISMMTKTPMSMGIMLLIQTFLMILIMNSMNLSSWIPMITFLTMIGGLLIIFMYMSSITSNEKFKFNYKMMFITLTMMMPTEELLNKYQNQEYLSMEEFMNPITSMTKMYNKSMMMTMLMVMYLMLTMITINKIIKLFEGPLRSNSYEQINT
uniref:NADH dehydrogenase subunit 6 n=1 Tax=Leptocentrus albolineatus TaxID=2605028 RepID=A0A5B9T591_9HEMI|nr:NADH dehydrogenase subunit 6 [Leptocentrus albolineatus]QEG98462.1 NADH dehydrogenase subunit 6 [Leptocentrus albolineatus]